MIILVIVAAGVINAGGSALLKYAMVYKNSPHPTQAIFYLLLVTAMAMFGGGFPLYATALSRAKLSTAQPIFSATTYLATILVSLLVLKEPLAPLKIAGVAVIIAGVTLVAS
jgi:multidrug transporter EmrE-like cation transporter